MKHLVPVIKHPRDVFTRPPAINILSTQWRAAGEILPNLLNRKRFGFSFLPIVITTHVIHFLCCRQVTRIKVSGVFRIFALSLSKASGLCAGLRVEQIVWLALDKLPARAYFCARTSTCFVLCVVAVCGACAILS